MNKARELERVLPGWRIELLAAGELPIQNGSTYYENALIKARFGRGLAARTSRCSARTPGSRPPRCAAGPASTPPAGAAGQQRRPALRELEDETDRGARYVCELVCLLPDGSEVRGRGTLEVGRASAAAFGGFGYDPVFVPKGETRTVAELGDDWKAQHSHRAQAARKLLQAIAADLDSGD